MEFSALVLVQWSAIIAVVAWCVYKLGTWTYDEFVKRGMAYEAPSFFFGSMLGFMLGRVSLGAQSLATYRNFKGHRAVGSFFFLKTNIYVRDPEVIKLITVKDFDHFTDHLPVVEEQDDLFFGKFLFSLKGSRWRAMRATLSPAFTSSKMKGMFLLVEKCGKQLGDYLEEKCQGEKDGVLTVEMKELFSKYANDVIATSAFGIHCDSLKDPDNEFFKRGQEATDFGGFRSTLFMLYSVIPRIMRLFPWKLTPTPVVNFFCSIVSDTMRVRERDNIVRPDMIQLLMEARKGTLKGDDDAQQDKKSTKPLLELSDDDITSQAFLFFLAGFDTSSTLLAFLAHSLALNVEIQERVQREIDEVLADDGGRVTYDGVQLMKYLDNVISETLRLWPPVVELDRVCLKDYVIPATETSPAITFKTGDAVTLPAYGIQRDPEHFPDPDRFDPERFSDENKHNIKPFTYIPFGVGPRACIGLRFALMETKIAMVCILSRFTFQVTAKTPTPIVLKKSTFNTDAEGGFWLGIKPRN